MRWAWIGALAVAVVACGQQRRDAPAAEVTPSEDDRPADEHEPPAPSAGAEPQQPAAPAVGPEAEGQPEPEGDGEGDPSGEGDDGSEAAAASGEGEVPPWKACERARDCAVVMTECCRAVAVSRAHREAAQRRLGHSRCDMVCPHGQRAGCRDGRCRLVARRRPVDPLDDPLGSAPDQEP